MSQKIPHSYSANQHDEHTTWVWPPRCSASDSSLHQSPNQKCLHVQMTIRNVRVLKSPFLPSSIYLQSHLSFCFSSLFCFCCNLRSNFHQYQSKCLQFEPHCKWLLLPQKQLCIPPVLQLHHPEGFFATSMIVLHFILRVFLKFPQFESHMLIPLCA